MAAAAKPKAAAHVLVYPWPVQGHINCMLYFATGLLGAGHHVTFLHSDHTLPTAAASPRLRYVSIPDGLPDGHPRNAGAIMRLMESVQTQAGAYRSLLASLVRPSAGDFPPVTCVVADGLMPFAVDIAEELGVPALSFRTASACSFLAYLSVPRLFELGELPFKEGDDLDMPVRGVPAMESFLRRRDLPSLCHNSTDLPNDPNLKRVVDFTACSRDARALVLNTAASMERAAVAHIAPLMRDVFAIGPLHAMSAAPTTAPAASVWREDDGCLAWLDGQPDRSVVYVSFGSLAVISLEQFTVLLSGLVAAGYPFLWVLRYDMVADSQSAALRETITAEGDNKARVVEWAPQREVLRHRAVGCFLTHAGWNSTLEAAVEGVPMVCWPFFADQQINSRFVGGVWKTGLDMKDVCDRAVVAKMVREAMESGQIRASAQALSQKVRQDVSDGGSSAAEFKRLIAFIEELSTVGIMTSAAIMDES